VWLCDRRTATVRASSVSGREAAGQTGVTTKRPDLPPRWRL